MHCERRRAHTPRRHSGRQSVLKLLAWPLTQHDYHHSKRAGLWPGSAAGSHGTIDAPLEECVATWQQLGKRITATIQRGVVNGIQQHAGIDVVVCWASRRREQAEGERRNTPHTQHAGMQHSGHRAWAKPGAAGGEATQQIGRGNWARCAAYTLWVTHLHIHMLNALQRPAVAHYLPVVRAPAAAGHCLGTPGARSAGRAGHKSVCSVLAGIHLARMHLASAGAA